MKKLLFGLLALLLIIPEIGTAVTKSLHESSSQGGLFIEASEPAGSIFQPGEKISFHFRSTEDAYVIVFNIDTDGYVHLLYPENGRLTGKSKASRRYTIPAPGESFLISGPTGMEFVFALCVEDRNLINDEELFFLAENENLPPDKRFRIDGDPLLAANMIAGELVNGISNAADVSLAYTSFFINEEVGYPRYICAQCHNHKSDPYSKPCPEYEFSLAKGEDSSLSYPLERGVEASQVDYVEKEDEAGEGGEDHATKVYISFYPFDSYVYVPPRCISYYYDPWFWTPLWYDPWFYWDPFFYAGAFDFGFYFSWQWNWGCAGFPFGTWYSCWYPWEYYSYYPRSYIYRPLRSWKSKRRSILYNTVAYNSRRNPDMRISSIKYKRKREAIRSHSSDLNLAGWKYKKARRSDQSKGEAYRKFNRRKYREALKHNKPHVRNTRNNRSALKKPRSKRQVKEPVKHRRQLRKDKAWRKPGRFINKIRSSGKKYNGRTSFLKKRGKSSQNKKYFSKRSISRKGRSSSIRSQRHGGSNRSSAKTHTKSHNRSRKRRK